MITDDVVKAIPAGANAESQFTVRNQGTAVTDHSILEVKVSGAGGGDPKILWTVTGVTTYSMGIDNSITSPVVDVFKLAATSALETTTIFKAYKAAGSAVTIELGDTTNGGLLDFHGPTSGNMGFEFFENAVIKCSFVYLGTPETFAFFNTAGTAKWTWDVATGSITVGDSVDLALNTGTGTKIGTGTTQKLGFWNAAPVVQHSATGEATGFGGTSGTTVGHTSTFTGNTGSKAYTLNDVVKAIKLAGIMASS